MSIRKGTSIIAGNLGQNIDDALSLTSTNPVQNKAITEELETKLGQSNITKCITKIPQDIKLELNGGALILKSGSKFYYPNGLDGTTLIFNSFTTASDLTLSVGGTEWTNKEHAILVLNDGTSSAGYACPDDLYSGDNPPTLSTQYACWYDTSSNIIRRTTDSGSTWTSTPYSFPICIAVNTGGNCDSISQIFNGFGCVGSTVFALPGVEGLIPDGRNEDGSLKNIIVTVNNVVIANTDQRGNDTGLLSIDGEIIFWDTGSLFTDYYPTPATGYWWLVYDTKKNVFFQSNDGGAYFEVKRTTFGNWRKEGNKITSLISKTPFHAVDYDDTEYMAHQAMPGNKYIDLVLGAALSEYVAPADGYFAFGKRASDVGQFFNVTYISPSKITMWSDVSSGASGNILGHLVPVQKNQKVRIDYNANGETITCRFIYAQGAV